MAEELALHTTPKRKRGEDRLNLTPINTGSPFSFRLPGAQSDEDGADSPRTTVTHRFKGLGLNESSGGLGSGGAGPAPTADRDTGGGGVAAAAAAATHQPANFSFRRGPLNPGGRRAPDNDSNDYDYDEEAEGLTMRKRQKGPEIEMRDANDSISSFPDPNLPSPPTPTSAARAAFFAGADAPVAGPDPQQSKPEPEPQPEPVVHREDTTDTTAAPAASPEGAPDSVEALLRGPYPAARRPHEYRYRRIHQRSATPPRSKGRSKKTNKKAVAFTAGAGADEDDGRDGEAEDNDTLDGDDEEKPAQVVDPVRASLTWHEDEITVYDPDDSDDDGTGVNGIGFKPTPALARIRMQKRRQQMMEYKKREDSEARARRSQRRHGGGGMSPSGARGRTSAERRVRFTEGEAAAGTSAITSG